MWITLLILYLAVTMRSAYLWTRWATARQDLILSILTTMVAIMSGIILILTAP